MRKATKTKARPSKKDKEKPDAPHILGPGYRISCDPDEMAEALDAFRREITADPHLYGFPERSDNDLLLEWFRNKGGFSE